MATVPDLSKEDTIPDQLATDSFHVEKLPHHLAIIMDGNGRWAQERNLSRIEGHRAGAESVRFMLFQKRTGNDQVVRFRPCGGC
jgi:undecaprenyl pyrophosphate synthase